jgi:GNAT superfamily N-acetyltransferase
VELTWLDPEHLDGRDVAGAVALLEAARVVDCPHELGPTVASFTANLQHGWDGNPPHAALVRDERDRVTGLLSVHLPRWDNTHLGMLEVYVDPLDRRRGLGRQLFEAGVARIRADGRRVVIADTWDEPAGVEFGKSMGMDRASDEVKRSQHLPSLDWPRLDREYASAERHADGYELLYLQGATPEELLADVANMTAAINDAPTDDLDLEDEVFSPDRIRVFEASQLAHGRRLYRVVARARESGEFAGHTLVGVESEQPWHGGQFDTSVLREHRGHRLGLLLKIAMLRWLAKEEPQLRNVDTWNAASNAHMIHVNEVLGYHVVAKAIGWQRHL